MQRTITQVTSNIKSPTGKPWTVRLSQHTVLSGPPESGKTRTMNAIELALTGECSDILFRESGKTPAFLVAFVHPEVEEAFSIVKFSDGSTAEWRMPIKGGRGTKATLTTPPGIDPDKALPVRAVRDALRGSADTASRFLLRAVGSELAWDRVRAGFTSEVGAIVDSVVKRHAIDTNDAVEALVRIREIARQAKTDHGAARRRLDLEIQGVGHVSEVTEDDVNDAVAAAKVATDPAEVTERNDRNAARRAWAAYNDAKDRAAEADRKYHEADETLKGPLPVPSQQGRNLDLLTRARGVVVDSIALAERIGDVPVDCLACGHVFGEDGTETATERLASITGAIDSLAQRVKDETAGLAKVKAAREAAMAARSRAEWDGAQAEKDMERASRELGDCGVDLDAPPDWIELPEEVPVVVAGVDDAVERVRDLQAQRSAWLRLMSARERQADAIRKEEAAKLCEAAVKSRIREVLDSAIGAFENATTAYLFEGESARVLIPEGKTDPLMVGRERDGLVHLGLTGSVGARMLMALATVIGTWSPFAVVLQEDRAMDLDTFMGVLECFSDAPVQIITQTTHDGIEAPESWTVVSL